LYDSFERIQSGEASAEDFSQVKDRWHLPALWEQKLHKAGLNFPLSTPVQHLSGDKQTRLALCRVFLQPDHYPPVGAALAQSAEGKPKEFRKIGRAHV
jgi:ATPase subunit of ABC transporter with duplicated ATPase domains